MKTYKKFKLSFFHEGFEDKTIDKIFLKPLLVNFNKLLSPCKTFLTTISFED